MGIEQTGLGDGAGGDNAHNVALDQFLTSAGSLSWGSGFKAVGGEGQTSFLPRRMRRAAVSSSTLGMLSCSATATL